MTSERASVEWFRATGGPRDGGRYMVVVGHYVEQRAAREWSRLIQDRLGDDVEVEVTPYRAEQEERPGVMGTVTVESVHLLTMDAAELQRAIQETGDEAVERMNAIIAQEHPLLLELLRVLRQEPPA